MIVSEEQLKALRLAYEAAWYVQLGTAEERCEAALAAALATLPEAADLQDLVKGLRDSAHHHKHDHEGDEYHLGLGQGLAEAAAHIENTVAYPELNGAGRVPAEVWGLVETWRDRAPLVHTHWYAEELEAALKAATKPVVCGYEPAPRFQVTLDEYQAAHAMNNHVTRGVSLFDRINMQLAKRPEPAPRALPLGDGPIADQLRDAYQFATGLERLLTDVEWRGFLEMARVVGRLVCEHALPANAPPACTIDQTRRIRDAIGPGGCSDLTMMSAINEVMPASASGEVEALQAAARRFLTSWTSEDSRPRPQAAVEALAMLDAGKETP